MRGYAIVVAALCCLGAVCPGQTDSLNILWNRNADPDVFRYLLQRSVNSTANFENFLLLTHPDTHAVDYTPQPGNLYAYRVAAIDSAGNISPFSPPVAVGIPQIQWPISTLPSTRDTTVALASFLYDPDHAWNELQISVSQENHIVVVVEGDSLRLLPSPINYIGPASFVLRAEDPRGFYDRQTINVSFQNPGPATALNGDNATPPATFYLGQNYPNPFNPVTNVEFGLPNAEWVTLKIYDLLGREVNTLVNEHLAAGMHTVQWDGTDNAGRPVAGGVYVYRLTVREPGVGKRLNFWQVRRMVLVR